MKKAWRMVLAFLTALVTIFFGLLASTVGYSVIREWHSIRLAYAAFGVSWILAGPLMFVAGWWVLGSVGRKPTPLFVGGTASCIAGAVLIAGVLAHVIPCSGPG
jgi:membrane protease YdiL (CAAX protease family)